MNLAPASLNALYRFFGLGRPSVRRDNPAQAAPRALDEAGQRRLLRAAEVAPIRARLLVMLMQPAVGPFGEPRRAERGGRG